MFFCSAALAADRSQDFSEDPGWEGVNNRISPDYAQTVKQDFGYSETSHTGGEKGEIGGLITRSLVKASYAKKIEPKTLQDKLTASGKFAVPRADGGSGVIFGWFNENSTGWRTPHSMVFRLDGNGGKYWVFFEYGTSEYGTGGGDTFEGDRYQTTATKPFETGDTVHEWTLTYDPEGAGGLGEMSFTLDGNTFTAPMLEGHKDQGATFDRFGMMCQMTSGSDMEIYYDDIELEGEKHEFNEDPEWEGVGNRATFENRWVRPFHDFGYNETDHAGGEKGEIGGTAWRIEDSRPENAGSYADADIGRLNLDQPLEASGRVSMLKAGADSAALLGWFDSNSIQEGPGLPRNFIGVMIEGPSRIGHYFRPGYMSQGGIGEAPGIGPTLRPDATRHEWTMKYDPEANSGNGSMTVTLDGKPVTLDLRPGARENGGTFDRFGWVTFLRGGHHVEIYFDDLKYTVSEE
jgi:hypothetical protein